jgi:hypothetical protein
MTGAFRTPAKASKVAAQVAGRVRSPGTGARHGPVRSPAKAGVRPGSWVPASAGMHGLAILFGMMMLRLTPCS